VQLSLQLTSTEKKVKKDEDLIKAVEFLGNFDETHTMDDNILLQNLGPLVDEVNRILAPLRMEVHHTLCRPMHLSLSQ